jgi:hypothetical protein
MKSALVPVNLPPALGREQHSRHSESLWTGQYGDRIPVRARFSVPGKTDPGAHPASYTMRIGSFPGVKRPGCGVDHPAPTNAKVKERVELYLCSPTGPSWPVIRRSWPYFDLLLENNKTNCFLPSTPTVFVRLVLYSQ